MKKFRFVFSGIMCAVVFTACNSGDSETTTTDSTTNTTTTTMDTAATTGASQMPLNAEDSAFVKKAAVDNRMEIESGNLAQQNAQSDRVKAFANMIVQDHQAAGQELMSLASGRGMMLTDSLPTDMQDHINSMKKMKGKAFDSHYVGMMLNDHQKTIAEFEKQASSGTDPELKAWAAKRHLIKPSSRTLSPDFIRKALVQTGAFL